MGLDFSLLDQTKIQNITIRTYRLDPFFVEFGCAWKKLQKSLKMASIGVHMVISSSQHRQRAGLIRTIQQNKFSVRRSRQRVAGSSNSNSNSNSNPEEDNKNTNAFSFSEDLNYLWTLGAGSVGGAVVIKYGSILFPAITRPNIIPALIMISMPMLIAVLLLIKQSRVDEQSKGPT